MGRSGCLASVIAVPVAAGLVHFMGGGTECGWNFTAVGGACRAIILVACVSGIGVGLLTFPLAGAVGEKRWTRAVLFAASILLVLAGGVWTGLQFDAFRQRLKRVQASTEMSSSSSEHDAA